MSEATYKIVRFHWDDDVPNEVIRTGLTLAEAQAHCKRPDSQGGDNGFGSPLWFDGYELDRGEGEPEPTEPRGGFRIHSDPDENGQRHIVMMGAVPVSCTHRVGCEASPTTVLVAVHENEMMVIFMCDEHKTEMKMVLTALGFETAET